MRYLWRRPIGLDNARLTAFLGEEPRTPLVTALRATLADAEEDAASRPCARGANGSASDGRQVWRAA